MNRYPSTFLILFIIPLATLFNLLNVFAFISPAYAATHTVNNTNNT